MQRALLVFDPRHQRADLLGHQVVDPDRDAALSGLIHEGRGLFDRLRPVHFRSLGLGRSPGDVDGRSRRAELHGDAASRSPACSGDQCNLACERSSHASTPT
jgi:hypothetical protein